MPELKLKNVIAISHKNCGSRKLMFYISDCWLVLAVLTMSTASILAQMNTSKGRSSFAPWSSLSTYGKMPTLSARWTAHGPRSRNLLSSSKALSLCT